MVLKRIGIILILLISTLFFGTTASAQTMTPERRAQLEQDLKALEKEIEAQRQIYEVKKNQRVSLERDIAILTAQINEAKLTIKARNLQIEKLNQDIGGKQKTITVLGDKIEREKNALADIIRKTNDLDSYSLVEVLLAEKKLSEFFADADEFDSVKQALRESYTEIADDKKETEAEKEKLEDNKQEHVALLALQQLQKKRLDEQEAEKKKILALSKGQEAEYQKILADKEKSAAAIRSALFNLTGSAAIPFEKALQYAKEASAKTGVRPAFILGIIAEESNLGQNVGTGNWRVDMHPTRDVPIFKAIAEFLGLNPDNVPVSKKPWYGYGGAMGPAQFIPSTWVCYGGFVNTTTGKCGTNPDKTWVGPWTYDASKDRIRALVGKDSPSNPWDPRDAFMASALLSKENGADKGTRSAERLAALRYLAGWTNATKPAYAFYGDDVMALADKYQKQIDILGAN